MVYYPTPMSKQTALKDNKKYIETPNSELLSQRVLSLPIHPYITLGDMNLILTEI